MPAELNLSRETIALAERILLRPGESFDEERRRFIGDFSTLDLLAVPGSGKTTALLAKLLILDRQLPRSDGAGVLMLSHTNAAIDEIRGRLGPHCTHLFRYPNFVGTIQRFVDEFIAIPYYANRYRRTPLYIDDVVYERQFKQPRGSINGFSPQEHKNALRYLNSNKKKIRWSWIDGQAVLTDGYNGKVIEFNKPRARAKIYTDWDEKERSRVKAWFHAFKRRLLGAGFLSYDDAYFLAQVALHRNSQLKSLLQRRFAHVFVDEMQDMDRHQYDLLEDLFFDPSGGCVAYQRIGDTNQSIYEDKRSWENKHWDTRERTLELNGSHRLSPAVARIASMFAVNPIRIDGRGKNQNGSSIEIKPHLIIYGDDSRQLVISRFAGLVSELANANLIPLTPETRIKAIGWTTKSEPEKTRLTDYYPSFERESSRELSKPVTLASQLDTIDVSSGSFAPIEQCITGSLLWILRVEGVTDSAGRSFVRKTMREFLQIEHPDAWDELQADVYQWCIALACGQHQSALQSMRQKLPAFCMLFGKRLIASKDFVFEGSPSVSGGAQAGSNSLERNVVVYGDVRVEVATIHRVKGETHCATLYLESFYEKGAGGSYESERMAAQLSGKPLHGNMHDYVRQSAKMMYVGFSRPTHLLCFALHESRFQKIDGSLAPGSWEIIRC